MVRINLHAFSILSAVLLAACEPQTALQAEQTAQAGDACNFLVLSNAQLQEVSASAERGSREAMKKLWDHYSCVDEKQAEDWQDRLIELNDADALLSRSSTLHLQANRLNDRDPKKLAMLREAQELEARGRKARGDGVMNVLVNGKVVAVPYSSAPDDYTQRLADEINRLSAQQAH